MKFIGYLFEYNYCIQITIKCDCLNSDSIKLDICSPPGFDSTQLESEFIAFYTILNLLIEPFSYYLLVICSYANDGGGKYFKVLNAKMLFI